MQFLNTVDKLFVFSDFESGSKCKVWFEGKTKPYLRILYNLKTGKVLKKETAINIEDILEKEAAKGC